MKNIDNFFKEKNEAFKLDNSSADMHWKQMQQQIIAKNTQIKYSKAAIAIAAVVGIAVLGIIYFNKQKENYIVKKEVIEVAPSNNPPKQTEVIPLLKEAVVIDNTVVNAEKIKEANNNNVAIDQTSFYIDLSKQPELFELETDKPNTITSKAGATITIPSNSIIFNNKPVTGKVTMTLQEYYKAGSNAAMLKYHFYQNDTLLQVAKESAIEIKLPKQSIVQKQLVFYDQSDNIADGVLQQMQWASTERFAAESKNKVDYKITLPKGYNAKTFMSLLAFSNQKVLIPGDVIGNSIVFKNIPKGESVYFISLGKANDKYFICNKKLTTTTNEIKDLNFLETSEGYYIKKFDELGALNKGN